MKVVDKIFGAGNVMEWVRILINNNFKVMKVFIRNSLGDKGNILDIGCGTGYFSRLFKNANYLGIDSSEEYVGFANKKYGGKFFVMDANKMNFKDKVFDGVLMISFLHHLTDEELNKILKDVRRVLKKDGKLIVIDPMLVPDQKNFIRKFIFKHDRGANGRNKEQILKLLNFYFKVDKYEVKNSISCTYQMYVCG